MEDQVGLPCIICNLSRSKLLRELLIIEPIALRLWVLVPSWSNKKDLRFGRSFLLEDQVGLEPTTPCLKGRCSNRLSYGPDQKINSLHYPYLQGKVNCITVTLAFFCIRRVHRFIDVGRRYRLQEYKPLYTMYID